MKAYIFDLGGVLVDIDIPGTFRKFEHMIRPEVAARGIRELSADIIRISDDYQRGDITTDQFLSLMQSFCHDGITRDQLLTWWNDMLLGLPQERMEKLAELKAADHQIFLLSNINDAHWEYCKQVYFRGQDMSRYFTRLFLSYEMHMIKPDACIYEEVIRQTGINPAETVYFDDLPENIAAGKAAGLQAIQVLGNQWLSLTDN